MSDCCDIFRFTDPGDGFSVGEGKVHIDVDSQLSGTSENPVQNKVIYNALQNFHIDVDDELSATSENPVQNKVITQELADQKSAIDEKQDAPSDAGLAGQVLGLDDDLNPVWLDQTGGGGSGGTTNYNNLTNKPRINGVLLSGDKSAADLGLATASDIPTVPVQSVNGKTGAVELDASDVGALPDSTAIPSKTSDLTNDSGFVNASGAAAAAPVQSVNGDTGDVTISVPSAASSGTPAMDGTASIGSSSEYARADHVHPTDTTRAAAAELATYVRPNLLDNWYFVGGGSQLGYGTFPINQRGQTIYANNGYSIDRWKINSNSSLTVSSDCITYSSGQVDFYQDLRQWFSQDLPAGTYTLSLLAEITSIGGTVWFGVRDSGNFVKDNIRLSSGSGYRLFTLTFTLGSTAHGWSTSITTDKASSNYVTANIKAWKLEIGSTQTLAHQENGVWVLNEIPDYAEQLLACQTSEPFYSTTGLSSTVGTIAAGGVTMFGRLAIVNIRIALTTSITGTTVVLNGLPLPLKASANYVAVTTNYQVTNNYIDGSGNVYINGTLESGAILMIACSYLID